MGMAMGNGDGNGDGNCDGTSDGNDDGNSDGDRDLWDILDVINHLEQLIVFCRCWESQD